MIENDQKTELGQKGECPTDKMARGHGFDKFSARHSDG